MICPTCGGPPPPVGDDSYFDEHKLRIENAHLKEEVLYLKFTILIFLISAGSGVHH